MKTFLWTTAMLYLSYSMVWAQPTSYGNLNQGNAGDNGGFTNSYFGYQTGANSTGFFNVFIGYQSGYNNTGTANIFIGSDSGFSNTNGHSNVFIGQLSGHLNTTGNDNTFLGDRSGRHNTNGNNNTFIGNDSGYNNETGSGNVFLGRRAGYNELGSDLLYIDNSDTSSPLIWGDFGNDMLRFNGSVRIAVIPQDDTLTRVLVTDNDGNIHWRDTASLSDGTGTDDQQLNLIGNALQLEDGGNVDLSTYLDNTDSQNLSLSGNTIAISNGTGVDISGTYATLASPSFTGTVSVETLQPSSHDTYDLGTAALAFSGVYSTVFYAGNALYLEGNEFLHGRNQGVAIGDNALGDVTATGTFNTAVGNDALQNNILGVSNTAVGHNALSGNTEGNNNVAVGRNALQNNSTGDSNVAVGYAAGPVGNTSNTVTIGSGATVTGDNTIAIGSGASATGNNAIAIGTGAVMSTDNEIRLGNYYTQSVGSAVNWHAVSDGRFKIDVKEDVAGLDFINALRPVSYNLDRRSIGEFAGNTRLQATGTDISEKRVGFIAQEVAQLVEAYGHVFTGVKKPTNDSDHYGLRYAEFVVPLTKAVQELSALVATQRQLIEAQQQEIERLKKTVYGNAAKQYAPNQKY